MAAVDDLEDELIAASEAGTGLESADAARLAINSATAVAIAKYVKTVVEGGSVATVVAGTLPAGPVAATGAGTVTLGL